MFLHNRLTSGDVTGRRMAVPRCARDEKSRVHLSGSHTTNGGLIFQASPIFPANLLHSDNGK